MANLSRTAKEIDDMIKTLYDYKSYKCLLIQQNTNYYSGTLEIGKSYLISQINGDDDFTNVGFIPDPESGGKFIATGTTPTKWTNGTKVIDIALSTPSVQVINENDFDFLGNITFEYFNIGYYKANLTNGFPQYKTIFPPVLNSINGDNEVINILLSWSNVNTIDIMPYSGKDDEIAQYMYLEIKVKQS